MFEGRSLTYGELNTRANQLAHLLIQGGGRTGAASGYCITALA